MQRICQVLGWLLLSILLVSGGTMSILILIEHPFWTSSPLRQHFIPLGHAHAGVLGVIMLIYGLYLDRVNLSEGARKLAAGLFIAGALIMPGGFLFSVLRDGASKPSFELALVPVGGVLVGVSFFMMFIGMYRASKTPS